VAVRSIRLLGDPILKSPTDPLDPASERAQDLVVDLMDTVALPGRAGWQQIKSVSAFLL